MSWDGELLLLLAPITHISSTWNWLKLITVLSAWLISKRRTAKVYPPFNLDLTQFHVGPDMLDVAPVRAQTRKAQNHEQGAALFDSSGPLFSQYLKIEEEDNKTAKRWQKDSMFVLVFVRTSVLFSITLHISSHITDRFILCRHCAIACRDSPGSQGQRTGYICVLPREYLQASSSRRFRWNSPFHPGSTSFLLCSELPHLGEFALVHEFVYQP
jgi:hypothetical protein